MHSAVWHRHESVRRGLREEELREASLESPRTKFLEARYADQSFSCGPGTPAKVFMKFHELSRPVDLAVFRTAPLGLLPHPLPTAWARH